MFQNNYNHKLKKQFGFFAIILFLFCWNHHHDYVHVVESLAPPPLLSLVSRQDFVVSVILQGNLLSDSLLFQKKSTNTDESSSSTIILPLRYLPVGGCWALKMIVSNDEDGGKGVTYYGVLDTGSPFLTAPSSVLNVTQPTLYPTTKEQYGESVGNIVWRKAPYITLLGKNSTILDSKNVVLGVVVESSKVIQESSGGSSIFVGMIPTDDNRPSFLQQLGGGGRGRRNKYKSFVVNFAQNYLQLFSKNNKIIIDENDPDSLKLVSLQPYGPDLYHFAIDCPQFLVKWGDGTEELISSSTLNRPVLCVLDTGLTGCIFSDSLQNELMLISDDDDNSRRRGGGNNNTTTKTTKTKSSIITKGLTVSLQTQDQQRTVQLPSSDRYWIYSSFRLPWFYDEEHHPHIIALGCTFWANVETMAIDTKTKRAKIKLRQQ